ncbi:MAG: 23S rRNA (guanosine(2251)-2'-O)-methyltransferase RlmB [Cyanobium sp.]
MSQSPDRRRPSGPSGRSPRRFDGPVGRAAGGRGPSSRPFRPGSRPMRPGAARPERDRRDGEAEERGRKSWESRPRRGPDGAQRRPEGAADADRFTPRERSFDRAQGRPSLPPRRGSERFAPSGPAAARPGGRAGGTRPGSFNRAGSFNRPSPSVRPPLRPAPLAERDQERGEGDAFAGAAPSDLIWGRHAAQAALESGRPLHRVWCTPEMRFSPRFLQLLREAKASGALVEEVTWARLGQISGGAVHQGIVLQPAAAETLDLASLIEGCRPLGEAPLLLAVDGLTDPQNLGAIVRSAEALGAHGLVLPQRRSAGLTGTVAKVAAGALEHLPIARVVNLNRSLDALKQEGYRVIGLAGEGTVSLEDADLSGPLVVVTGSEGDGLSMLTRRHCDQLVRIPLRGATPSLNASVATALLLYEVARRSWMQGLSGTAPAPRLVRPALPQRPPAQEQPPAETVLAEPEGSPAAAELPRPQEVESAIPDVPDLDVAMVEPVREGSLHAESASSDPSPTHPEAPQSLPADHDPSAGVAGEQAPATAATPWSVAIAQAQEGEPFNSDVRL